MSAKQPDSGTYSVVQDSDIAPVLSKSMERAHQQKLLGVFDFRQDANLKTEPEYFVYIFNIAPRKFEIRRPPSFPLITFAPCPTGERYALVGQLPNIVNEVWEDGSSGEIRVRGIHGERFAMDLINPTNIGVDMWAEITQEQMTWVDGGGTDDLSRRGLFWTLHETPTEEELVKARERMQRHYKALLQHADQLARENKVSEIGFEHHLAAQYFKVKATWHVVAELPSECPNCGETIKEGIAFHANSMGLLCVINWKRAVEAGVVKREDVPEGFQWWTRDESAPKKAPMPTRGAGGRFLPSER